MFSRAFQNGWRATLLLALTACSESTDPAQQTIVVFGASGNIGGLIVAEALERGHRVVGISRSPDRFAIDHASFSALRGDVTSVESFRDVVQGADAVIISVQGTGEDNAPENSTHARSAVTAVAVLTPPMGING